MGERNHVLLSADENYIMQAVVSINSIILNNKDMALDFHIFYSKVSESTKNIVTEWMEREHPKTGLSFHEVQEEKYMFPIKPGDAVSAVTYFRILAPDILPSEIQKILYVDCDTITVGSLRELFAMDLKGYGAACARGDADQDRKTSLGLKAEDQYFQAGVMMLNLEYWRSNHISQKVLTFIRENPDSLPRWDQDALNAILVGKYLLLDQKWNTCLGAYPRNKKFAQEPVILHYTGFHRYKPWWKNTLSQWQDVYMRYRKGTPYEGQELKWCGQYQYRFEKGRIPQNSKAVLYAAGEVGKDFYQQNRMKNFCDIVAWVDRNYEKIRSSEYPVQSLQVLKEDYYDIVLIAVEREKVAEEIIKELQEAGIDRAKLIWLAPQSR